MAKDGLIHLNPFNEVDNKSPNDPDSMGEDLYFGGFDEVLKNHLSETGNLVATPNSDGSHDTFGGPTTGEPNPVGMAGMGGGYVAPRSVEGGAAVPTFRGKK